jgi:7,8-dihydropterin-6-yl-methyl-4-(beta-D-ribofuranosyl)aminobenzene 5'-phosphate synthase
MNTLRTLVLVLSLATNLPAMANDPPHQVNDLKITILSTMLSGSGIGEWGFAALIEADGNRFLFDTGHKPETVRLNAEQLGVDLSNVTEVVLSHNHYDHTGGLVSLREHYGQKNPQALSKAHAGRGIFWKRQGKSYDMVMASKAAYEKSGGQFIIHGEPVEIHPGIWLTGPVPRVHPEKNFTVAEGATVTGPDGVSPDNIPESLSMVIHTPKGLVVISGCGHAGLINTLEYAQQFMPATDDTRHIHTALGGFHLAMASDEHLDWTAGKLKGVGLQNFVGAHCTGLQPVYHFREALNLPRSNSVVGAVGGTFSLVEGIKAGVLAH